MFTDIGISGEYNFNDNNFFTSSFSSSTFLTFSLFPKELKMQYLQFIVHPLYEEIDIEDFK